MLSATLGPGAQVAIFLAPLGAVDQDVLAVVVDPYRRHLRHAVIVYGGDMGKGALVQNSNV